MKKLPKGLRNGKWWYFALVIPFNIVIDVTSKAPTAAIIIIAMWQAMFFLVVFMWWREQDDHQDTLQCTIKMLEDLRDIAKQVDEDKLDEKQPG